VYRKEKKAGFFNILKSFATALNLINKCNKESEEISNEIVMKARDTKLN